MSKQIYTIFSHFTILFLKKTFQARAHKKTTPPPMSARKAIKLLEQQIADHKAHRRERYERIFDTYADEADRDAAIERDRAQGLALQERLLDTLRQEHSFLLKKTTMLRIRNEARTPVTAAQALRQRLAAKLAEKNTVRTAYSW